MRIVLIGYRGTGKTVVGRILAERKKLRFLDTDLLIETREGETINEIFRTKGELYFRKVEKEIIADLPKEGIISTGGGAVLNPENVARLRAASTVILLSAKPETLIERIARSRRPRLTELSLEEEVQYHLENRRPAYLKAADFCLDTTGMQVSTVVTGIEQIMEMKMISIPSLLQGSFVTRDDRALLAQKTQEYDVPLRICAVIGYPVSHSRSPALFNGLFSSYHLPYHYIRMEYPTVKDLIEFARTHDFRGLSVTIPFKSDVIPYLDEIDPTALTIGAVNTVVRCGGRNYGYNTDWLGIRRPLLHLKGAKAAIIGAGGAAAAAVYACLDLEMQVTILNRTPERGADLARRFGCRSAPLSSFAAGGADLVINATPVGMHPDIHTPIPLDLLIPGMTVFDLVYTPPDTPLLRGARERGCTTISGVEMFIHQAREQFSLFTGISVPDTLVRGMLS